MLPTILFFFCSLFSVNALFFHMDERILCDLNIITLPQMIDDAY